MLRCWDKPSLGRIKIFTTQFTTWPVTSVSAEITSGQRLTPKYLITLLFTCISHNIMPSSHHRHGQDKTVLSCLVRVRGCEQNWRQAKTVGDRKFQNCFVQSQNAVWTVLSRSSFQFATRSCLQTPSRSRRQDWTKLFSLWYIEDYWKQSWQFCSHHQQDKTCRWCELDILRIGIVTCYINTITGTSYIHGGPQKRATSFLTTNLMLDRFLLA